MLITSTNNDRLKHAKRVREGREPGLIFIEGLRLAEEALRSGMEIECCLHVPREEPRHALLLDQLTARRVLLLETTADILASLSDTVQSQGMVLLGRRPAPSSPEGSVDLMLGLDRLQDPGNMGTLIRTAEAAGVQRLLSLGGSVDVYSPKVLRSSMGSAFRLPIQTHATPSDLLHWRQSHGLCLVAAAGEGELDYCDYDWRQPTLLLLGNEGRGVETELMSHCDARLRIPMLHGVESLNVASAGAVMLFEAARQRRCGR